MNILTISPVVVDNTLSLRELARTAVGENNFYNICPSIPFESLKHTKGVGVMYPMLALPSTDWETAKKAAQRLVKEGYILGNIAELAQVLICQRSQIAKHPAVFALEEESRWLNSDGDVCVPYVNVKGFSRYRFDHLLDPDDCILVFEQVKHRSSIPLLPAVV